MRVQSDLPPDLFFIFLSFFVQDTARLSARRPIAGCIHFPTGRCRRRATPIRIHQKSTHRSVGRNAEFDPSPRARAPAASQRDRIPANVPKKRPAARTRIASACASRRQQTRASNAPAPPPTVNAPLRGRDARPIRFFGRAPGCRFGWRRGERPTARARKRLPRKVGASEPVRASERRGTPPRGSGARRGGGVGEKAAKGRRRSRQAGAPLSLSRERARARTRLAQPTAERETRRKRRGDGRSGRSGRPRLRGPPSSRAQRPSHTHTHTPPRRLPARPREPLSREALAQQREPRRGQPPNHRHHHHNHQHHQEEEAARGGHVPADRRREAAQVVALVGPSLRQGPPPRQGRLRHGARAHRPRHRRGLRRQGDQQAAPHPPARPGQAARRDPHPPAARARAHRALPTVLRGRRQRVHPARALRGPDARRAAALARRAHGGRGGRARLPAGVRAGPPPREQHRPQGPQAGQRLHRRARGAAPGGLRPGLPPPDARGAQADGLRHAELHRAGA